MKEGELHQTGRGLDIRTGDAARPESVAVEAASVLAQVGQPMGMCPLSLIYHQISTPRVLNVQEHDASFVWP